MLYGCAVQGVPERYILFLEKINLFGSQYMCFSTAFGLARSGVHNVSSENYSIQLAGEMYSLYSKVPQHALQATAILFCSLKKKETVVQSAIFITLLFTTMWPRPFPWPCDKLQKLSTVNCC